MFHTAFDDDPLACPGGLHPYPGKAVNALNPCFISLISLVSSILFSFVGLIQFYQLYKEKRAPKKFKYGSLWKSLSTKHILHLADVGLQAVLIFNQLVVSKDQVPLVSQWSFICNLIFVVLISFPSQYLQFYKSTSAIGSNLFYFLTEILILLFQLGQRIGHFPDERYNVIKGTPGAYLEVLLLINSIAIFLYDLVFYKPSEELLQYYTEQELYPSVNVFANLTFTWMNKLITQTYHDKKIKDPHHMPLPPIDLNIRDATKQLQSKWENEKWSGRNSLLKALFNAFGKTILMAIALETVKDFIAVIQPQFLRLFIEFFNEDYRRGHSELNGLFIALALFLLNLISTCLSNQFFILIFEAGLSMRGSLMSMVYQKSLNLSVSAREQKSTGDILNLMSVDVLKIQRFFENSQTIIGAPIQLVVVLISLYILLGNATIGGLVTMAIMIPINSFLSKKVKTLYRTQMKYKDARIKTITEILNSVKSIKLYAWEKPMLERLDHCRNDLELENFKKIGIVSNLIYFAWKCIPVAVTCSTFAIFSLTSDMPLSPQIVFPSLSLFNILNDCIYSIPSTINNIIETGVSIKRLKDFLLAEELDDFFIERLDADATSNSPAIEICNATFLWKSTKGLKEDENYDEEAAVASTKVALKNIRHFEARKGDLTCIVGRVGSGKSTFLQAILGQLPCISGLDEHVPPKLVIRAKSIAYCPQQPWIMNASLKDNVIFGHRLNEDYYKATIRKCQLLPDLDILPDGDQTLVGEKGISLSGGQKARLSLARAVYARADVYLLDDILSAVDAEVSKNIVEQVLNRETGILKNKTVILTTNAVSVLKHSQNIYALLDGEIVENKSYADAMSCDHSSILKTLIQEFDSNENSREDTKDGQPSSTAKDDQKSFHSIKDEQEDRASTTKLVYSLDTEENMLNEVDSRRASLATLKPRPILDLNADTRKTAQLEEKSEEGKVKSAVYRAYLEACGSLSIFLFFFFMAATKFFDLGDSFWLKYWSENNEKTGKNEHIWMYVAVYALIGLGSAAFTILRSVIMMIYCSIKGSKKLHDTMARAVLRSPMSFFETTPVGRIINRFSSDVNVVDQGLQFSFTYFFIYILNYLFTVILISFNMPLFLLFNGILLVLYFYYQIYYITLSRELKRLTSISYSPIMSLLSETLGGHLVINAYKHLQRFTYLNNESIQFNINCMFNFRSTNRWLSMRLQTIGAVLVLLTALLSLSTINTDKALSSGMVGLLMSYALQVTTSLTWIVRMSVQVETDIVSVERILEYCNLPPEADAIIEESRPPKEWPSRGAITFQNYSTKYRENLDPVLKDITVEIKPQEKIGIVGRTGAGKSTLSLALFRLLEPSGGSIVIDGIDIAKLGLSDLRGNLAIIPQDAQAFEGTIKSNLDPFGQYSDEEIWRALELSHLKPHILKMASEENTENSETTTEATRSQELLSAKITENGGNLSIGQRQLLCLSRALLNHSKILVLDEATAAVDMETDKIIQETIKTAFKDRTILTIAHRIDTVMDSDKIMVLDKGEVKEFDTPTNLLADKSTIFYNLCEKGGYLKSQN